MLDRRCRQAFAIEPVGVFEQGGEGLGGVFRESIDRIAVLLEKLHPRGYVYDAHEAAEDGLGRPPGDPDDGLRGAQGIGHGLWGQDDQRPVHAGVVDDGPQGVFVPFLGGVPDDIDGVVDVCGLGEMPGELLHRLLLELRELEIGGDRHVGGDDAGAPGVGDDRHAPPRGKLPHRLAQAALLLVREGVGVVEELIDRVRADDARLLEDCVVDGLGAGEGSGVGRRGLGPGAGAPRLDDQDRRGVPPHGDLPGRLDELRSPPELLDVQHDDRRIRVPVQVAQQVQFIHVGLVADGDELGEPEIPVGGEIQHGRAQGAALGDEGNAARRRHPGREAGVQPDGRDGIDHPEAVRPDDANPRLAADGDDLVFNLQPLAADLPEAGGDDDDAVHAFYDGLLDGLERLPGRQDEDCQVDGVGDVADCRDGFDAENGLRPGVDGKQGALVSALEDVREDVVSDFSGFGGGADDGNGFGPEYGIEIFKRSFSLVHRCFPPFGKKKESCPAVWGRARP